MAISTTGNEIVIRISGRDRFSPVLKSVASSVSAWRKQVVFALGAIASAAAYTAATFEHTMRETAAIMKDSQSAFEKLSKKARQIGENTTYSAVQASAAMYDLASAGLSVTEVMNATTDAMYLAGATASEMSTATRLMAATMRTFGEEAQDTAKVAHTFATAITSSLFTMESLSEAMKYGATIGASLGHSLSGTVAGLAAFANFGLAGSLAGTQMRMAMLTLASASERVKTGLAEVGVTFDQVNPKTHEFGMIV